VHSRINLSNTGTSVRSDGDQAFAFDIDTIRNEELYLLVAKLRKARRVETIDLSIGVWSI